MCDLLFITIIAVKVTDNFLLTYFVDIFGGGGCDIKAEESIDDFFSDSPGMLLDPAVPIVAYGHGGIAEVPKVPTDEVIHDGVGDILCAFFKVPIRHDTVPDGKEKEGDQVGRGVFAGCVRLWKRD